MKSLKILLRENVSNLGLIGDVVNVAPGYARNYLIPNRIAVEATPDNVKVMERRRKRYDAEMLAREADINARVEALGRLKLTTKEKADESGSLYGSVGAAKIAQLLTDAGHETTEKAVRLDEPIKTVGTHEVPVHVHGDHYAGIQVVVTAE